MHELILNADATWTDIPGGWVALIGVFLTAVVGPVAVLIVTARLSGKVKAIRSDVAITRDHVANSHVDEQGRPINMREEQDRYQRELVRRLDTVIDTQRDQGRDIGGMREDIRRLAEADLEQTRIARRNRDRIDDLERTRPPRPRPQKSKEQQ